MASIVKLRFPGLWNSEYYYICSKWAFYNLYNLEFLNL